jgi:hypothetical protein
VKVIRWAEPILVGNPFMKSMVPGMKNQSKSSPPIDLPRRYA